MDSFQKSIFQTLVYADIFSYPLTFDQLKKFLITSKKIDFGIDDISKAKGVLKREKYFFLKGRSGIVKGRVKRERYAREKTKIAQKTARILKLIPFIKMVGITGNLAMKNTDQRDDIDFLIITSKDRLWLSRFLVVFLLEFLGKRRHPRDKEVKNKICLNMFLDEDHLKIPQKEQNLFSAHEVLQFKPLWQRGNIYDDFLNQNQWVKKFLANWKS